MNFHAAADPFNFVRFFGAGTKDVVKINRFADNHFTAMAKVDFAVIEAAGNRHGAGRARLV